MQILKFEKTENIVKILDDEETHSFNLFTVQFKDEEGKLYSWSPKWHDLGLIFLQACITEYYNDEENPAKLGEFIEVARRIIDQAF